MSTLIIGGGVIGTTLAYHLTKRGTDVTLLDAGELGCGTTAASFSMHIAIRKTPRDHFDLAVEGGREHHRLAEDLGVARSTETWIHPCACYEWPTSSYEETLIRDRVERLTDWGYQADLITRNDLRELEPHLEPWNHAPFIVRYPNEAWYDAPLLTRHATNAAQRQGAQVIPHQRVASIRRAQESVTVTTAEGNRYEAQRVVITAGAESRSVAALAGLELPVNKVPGVVVTTAPLAEQPLKGIVLHPEINIRPGPEGRLVYHSYYLEGRALNESGGRQPYEDMAREMNDLVTSVLPTMDDMPSPQQRVGVRPVPADGLPIVGWLDDDRRVYSLVTHSAVNFAPALAKYACEELVAGTSVPKLATFRPSRPSLVDPDNASVDESAREMQRMFAEAQSE